MSELSDKIEGAVLNALSDQLPGPVVGFVGIATYLDDEGGVSYSLFNRPDAHLGESMGLARQVDLFYEEQYRRFIRPDDEDD